MLSPDDRSLLFESLRPPPGYELGYAIGTTYSLDLLAVLAVPLAFTFFGADDEDGRLGAHPLAALEAVRRHANQVAVFCQAGQIKIPPHDQLLYSHVEESVFEVTAPHEDGVFHPKLWVMRFVSEDGPVLFRVLCLSRNLTFDQSWDTALRLEGTLSARKRPYGVNTPLSEFIGALPSLALRKELTPTATEQIAVIQEELRRVDFELPESVKAMKFWPLGLSDRSQRPFEGRIDRLLTISPFIGPGALSDLSPAGSDDILVSREEELDRLGRKQVPGFPTIKVLNEGACPEPDDDQAASPSDLGELTGLHAKVYVADAGWDARVWVGSANATVAAFEKNVEFLVELHGKKSVFGIDQIMGPDEHSLRFGDLLVDYPLDDEPVPEDKAAIDLERQAEGVKRIIAELRLVARVVQGGDAESGFTVELTCDGPVGPLPDGLELRAWPVTMRDGAASPLDLGGRPVATFKKVALESLTTFYAVELRLSQGGQQFDTRFVLNLPLQNAPEKRQEAVLRAMLVDQAGLMRYLLFLLHGEDDPLRAAAALGGGGGNGVFGTEAVFELLVRALDRNPVQIDQVARVISDLRETPDGEALLPAELAAVWEPVWRTREGRRSS